MVQTVQTTKVLQSYQLRALKFDDDEIKLHQVKVLVPCATQARAGSQRCMEVVKYSDQGFLEALPNVSKADCHTVTVAPLILDTRG